MIVKKIPILQGFPAPDTVNYLSNVKNKLSDNNAIFYDIETTGLSRYTASVYLIGAVHYEKNQCLCLLFRTEVHRQLDFTDIWDLKRINGRIMMRKEIHIHCYI